MYESVDVFVVRSTTEQTERMRYIERNRIEESENQEEKKEKERREKIKKKRKKETKGQRQVSDINN